MEHSVQRFLFPYTKIRPVHYKVSGALKTDSFLTAARSLQGRSYAAGGARYLLPDLMLLTHAGCAFKDPRGRFGISNTLPGAVRGPRRARERNQKFAQMLVCTFIMLCSGRRGRSFALLRCAVIASAEQPPCGLGCRCSHCQPLFRKQDYLYSSTRRVRCS